MAKTLLLTVCGACLLSGCQVLHVCPAVQGTVVDAATGNPVKFAQVTIRYLSSGWVNQELKPEQVARTDSLGRYAFAVRNDLIVLLPVPLDPVLGFSIKVEADGYHASDLMQFGPWIGVEPPAGIEEGHPPGIPKMVYDGETIAVAPIALSPDPAPR
jgi:hypothetical protein